jgi:hypothetical protein
MNHTKILPQEQGTKVLSRLEIAETREKAFEVASGLSTKQILTHMAMFNAYAWRAAVNYQALERAGEYYSINHKEWNNLLNCSHQGQLNIVVANDWLSEYVRNNWSGAHRSEDTLRKYRKYHIEWGLFWFDIENRPKGAFWGKRNKKRGQATATPPVLERVDLARILIFYQVFDRIRRDRINQKLIHSEDVTAFDCMPDHGGMVMVEMYNALNISDFQGNVGALDIVTESQAEVLPAIAPVVFSWKYNPKNHLHRSTWKKLVESAGFVAKRAKKIFVEIVTELAPIGTLEEVPY